MKEVVKHVILTSALVTALSAVPLQHADAAPVQKKLVATSMTTIQVDGKSSSLRSVEINGKKMMAIRDFAQTIGATINWDSKERMAVVDFNGKTILALPGSKDLQGGNQLLDNPAQIVNGSLFLDVKKLASALGLEIDEQTNQIVISTVKLLDGSNTNPRWVNANKLLVLHSADEKESDFAVNVSNKKYEALADASSAVVSPDGKKAAYTNEESVVFVVDLETNQINKVSDDNKIKSELQWSDDSKSLYYLEGDKMAVVAKMNLADGAITKVLDDKESYKTDLRVSADEKTILYTIAKSGKVEGEADTLKVDNTGTEPQLYVYDTTKPLEKDAKVKAITSTKDNKVFAELLKNGKIAYVSVDTENENSLPVLKVLSVDGKESKDMISDISVLQSILTSAGNLLVLAVDQAGQKAIYDIDADSGTKKKLYDVDTNTVLMYPSLDGKQLAITIDTGNGEKVAIQKDGRFVSVTK